MMRDQKILAGLVIGAGMLISGFIMSGNIFADEADITFPVAELGNCASKSDCLAYCDKEENRAACLSFAEEKGLIPPEEIQRAKKFLEIGTGPGGCKNQKACESFCAKTENIPTCIDFAKKNGLMDEADIEEAEKVVKHLRAGNKLPGGCTNKQQCEAYCAVPSHGQECLSFAEKAGFIKKDEVERARKFLPLLEKGETPGGCKNKDQCEAYCQQEEHVTECSDFALKIGAISEEDHATLKKTGGTGPGGCKRDQCHDFCNDPANQEVCLKFAEEHGFIEKHRGEEIRQGAQHIRERRDSLPPQVKSCIEAAAGPEQAQKIQRGEIVPGSDLGQTISKCFRAIEGPQDGESEDTPRRSNPGGCRSNEECRAYCSDPAHNQECGIQSDDTRDDTRSVPSQMPDAQELFDRRPPRPPSEFDRHMSPPDGFDPASRPDFESAQPRPEPGSAPSSYAPRFLQGLMKELYPEW